MSSTGIENHIYRLTESGPVVVVDDALSDVKFFKTFYKRSKIKNPILDFHGGQELLAYLNEVEAGTKEMPSIVFLDVNMPKMDGLETLALMRKREPFREVPVVVMLTSSNQEKDKAAAKEGGAQDYIVKPLEGAAYVDFFNSLAP